MALLRRLQDDGKTLLVVEHNTRVVQKIADDVLFLHQGHLMAQGIARNDRQRSRAGGNLFRRGALMVLRLHGLQAGYGREDGDLRRVVRAGTGPDPGVPGS